MKRVMLLAALPCLFCASCIGTTSRSPRPAAPLSASRTAVSFTPEELLRINRLSPLPPVPADPTNHVSDDPAAARLGQYFFFEKRLSGNGRVSCASCHDPAKNWTDGQATPVQFGLELRHVPSLWNVAYNRWFFWDGRADSLWAQAAEPIENPIEMGSSRLQVAHHVAAEAELARAYEDLFGPLPTLADSNRFPAQGRQVPAEPEHPHQRAWASMTAEDQAAVDRVLVNVTKSIAAYERLLHDGPAPFDRFVEGLETGDPEALAALDEEARRGLSLFVGRGRCVLCHDGPTLTDSEFHNTGVAPRPGIGELDSGRYGGLRLLLANPLRASREFSDDPRGEAARRVESLLVNSESWGEFKTPTLRGVARRGPFMHAGQFSTLEEVLRFYSTLEGADGRSHHQEQVLTPLRLEEGELADLLAFLRSLSGASPPKHLLGAPASPFPAGEQGRDRTRR
jgi:cytochrome c peroxidase